MSRSRGQNVEDLHDLVAIVVDHLDRDLPGLGPCERPGLGRYRLCPRVLVDVGLQSPLEPRVRVLAASEVAVADEERLLVVGSVDHPQGDLVGSLLRISPVLGS